ncbi:hypothetical protein BDZ85DRAFT_283366 [Elsinoe ampelina]|uniref:Uncharacterized protein n=1 Tax=Elsinoe ampelina TaxID=302913 RepID=A0A6A6G7A9_9PEZI|nr:hypothetical protein BDZ85DRAFT_283366 [Elsinoe ampelina]
MSVENHTIDNPKTAPWGLRITEADYHKMAGGFEAEQMEQQWEVVTEKLDGGRLVVHIARSWTKEDFYILTVAAEKEGGSAVVEKLTWENKPGHNTSEEQGKEEAVELVRGLLGCDLDGYPGGWRPAKK